MALIQASIEQLRVGHYIHLPTGWTSHPFMFNAFKIRDQQQLEIIRHLELTLLMVDPDKSDLPVEPLLRAEPAPSFELGATQDASPEATTPPRRAGVAREGGGVVVIRSIHRTGRRGRPRAHRREDPNGRR